MALPLFSEMLSERRRQLGLPISQVSSVLRLKEDVLIAFEQGDFDGIPKSGYAQGMLSSYARYLGLDAKEVVEQFSADLYEHNVAVERSGGSQSNRRAAGAVSEASVTSSRRTTVESHGLLPTSGGFAGDMGDFATTSRPRPRTSGSGSYGSEDSYDSYDRVQEPYYGERGYELSPTPLAQTRPAAQRATRTSSSEQRRSRRSRDTRGRRDRQGSSSRRSTGTRERSNRRGRSERQVDRLTRRTGRGSRQGSPRGGTRPAKAQSGLRQILLVILDDRRILMGIAAAMGLALLVLMGSMVMRSCSSSGQDRSHTITMADEESQAGSSATPSDEAEQDARSVTSADDQARADAVAKATEKEALAEERQITVSVEEGSVPWVEITCDDKSEVADQVTGPWSKTYKVKKLMTINVDDPAAVQVTEDGKPLEFESKASGIGTISVEAAGNDSEEDAKDADGTEGESQGEGEDGSVSATDSSDETYDDALESDQVLQ